MEDGFARVDRRFVQVETRFEAVAEAIDIPLGAAHRVANRDDVPLVFVEVQTGDHLGEDDIERLEDDYGRFGAEEKPVDGGREAGP